MANLKHKTQQGEAGEAGEAKGPARAVRLRDYDKTGFDRGRPWPIELLWKVLDAVLVRSKFPGSAHRRFILRAFGAQIGKRVLIKPGVRITFPWRLTIGDDSWIGEAAWIDNLAAVTIGANCCLSQGAYICTGSHDWSQAGFDLIVRPVTIGDGAWLAAQSMVGPGVSMGEGAVLSLGSAANGDLQPWSIYSGVPARRVRQRELKDLVE